MLTDEERQTVDSALAKIEGATSSLLPLNLVYLRSTLKEAAELIRWLRDKSQ